MNTNDFINSIDNKLYNKIRKSQSDAECRRYLKEHLQKQLKLYGVVGRNEQLVCDICEEPLDKVLGKVCENTMCDRHR